MQFQYIIVWFDSVFERYYNGNQDL